MNLLFIGIIISGIGFIGTLAFNIFRGTFSIGKFFNGFNIFSGGVQGKLIYYLIIGSIVAAVALGIYHRFTQETYENTYTNTVKAEEVVIDQRQILPNPDDSFFFGVKIFGFKLGIARGKKTTIKAPEVTNKIKATNTEVYPNASNLNVVEKIKEKIKPTTKKVWFFFKKKVSP